MAIAGPASRAATGDETLKTCAQAMNGYVPKNTMPIRAETTDSMKKPLETHLLAASRSSLPFASEIAFKIPFPIPRSAKFSSAATDMIVIHKPKRSVPK